jgi:hypothetical protein
MPASRTPVAAIRHARGDEIRIDLVRHAGAGYLLIEAKANLVSDEPMPRKLGAVAIRANEVKLLLGAIEQALVELENRSGDE